MPSRRRAGIAAAAALAPVALAYRFAIVYRERAGLPRRRPPRFSPADFGLAYEDVAIPSDGGSLPAWFVPAPGGDPGPVVVMTHGWESARDRSLPTIQFLHAAGFHCLAFDVRGHGDNPAEELPVSSGEFAADTLAALDVALARPDVTKAALFGHSLGGTGAILAAAAAGPSRATALVAVATPSDPHQLTRLTFQLARLPFPDPVAHPLAWLTTRVYLRPRGHRVRDVSARLAIARYTGPTMLAHATGDLVVPLAHLRRLEAAADDARRVRGQKPAEVLVIEGGSHSWLYELPEYRRRVARFLAVALGGPLEPDEAAAAAEAVDARRLPEPDEWFVAVTNAPSRVRTLGELAGAVRPLSPARVADESGGRGAEAGS